MDSMILRRPLKSFQALHSLDREMTSEEQNEEMALIMGGSLDPEIRDRELQAFSDRIKILEAELQKARAEAYQAGYGEGQQITLSESRKQLLQMTQEFSDNLSALHAEFSDTIDKLSGPVLKLALGVSEKLIHRELDLNDAANEILLTQVRNVLNETVTQSRPVVHVNISQLEWITGIEILKTLNALQNGNLRFIPNPTVKPGECKLETEDFLIDATIKAQLENLEKVLRDSDAAD